MRLPAQHQDDRNERINIEAIRIEVAETHAQRLLAHGLLCQQYQDAGYLPPPLSWPSKQEITLLAMFGERAVATLTMRFDSPAGGLLADRQYGVLVNQYRQSGRMLCEFIRFAIAVDAPVMQVLGKLLAKGWPIGPERYGVTDIVVECHPRHSAFYRRALAFRIVGNETTCERVGAPAVLLHLPVERLHEQHLLACSTCSENRTRKLQSSFLGLPNCRETELGCAPA